MTDIELEHLAKSVGFTNTAPLRVDSLSVKEEVRDACKKNVCGRYGKNWSCPPACGDLDACRRRLCRYGHGLIVQTVGELQDEFDWDGMKDVESRHKDSFHRLHALLREQYSDMLPLGAGSCSFCESCSYPDAPCRFPEKMVSSMEAYGLLVLEVCKANGIKYYYGPRSISYTSCILLPAETVKGTLAQNCIHRE